MIPVPAAVAVAVRPRRRCVHLLKTCMKIVLAISCMYLVLRLVQTGLDRAQPNSTASQARSINTAVWREPGAAAWAFPWRVGRAKEPLQGTRSTSAAGIGLSGVLQGLGRTGQQALGQPVTAEEVERAMALDSGHGAVDGPCAGGWCQAYLNQPLLEMEPHIPPPDKPCPDNCSGNGVCFSDTGVCLCPAWWDGPACAVPRKRKCQSRSRPGPASSCAGFCDERLAHCLCPATTTYGGRDGRSLAHCKPDRYAYFDDTNNYTRQSVSAWDTAKPPPKGVALSGGNAHPALLFDDPRLHAPNVTTPGWCVAPPGEPTGVRCPCVYDGATGPYCEVPTLHTCLLDCSGRGRCEHGFCWCESGYYGLGCERVSLAKYTMTALATTPWPLAQPLRRPLIYVYDLSKEFNLQIFQYRWDKGNCFHRTFNELNRTVWTHGGRYLEPELHEALLVSAHRTLDPEAADFFYVPLYLTCFIWPVADFADQPRGRDPNRNQAPRDLVLDALRHIRSIGPYWDRNGGRDHLWFFSHDEGACWAPADIWNSVMLSHWGRMDLFKEHPVSSSAYWPDNFDNSPEALGVIGNHPCHDPDKDIVIPPFVFHAESLSARAAFRAAGRDILFFFAGNDGSERACENPDKCYSRGIRQSIHRLFSNATGFRFKVDGTYSKMLSRSVFCLVAAGDGFSTRMEDAVLHGCIPVIIIDNTISAWGTQLNTAAFSVRVPQSQVPDLETILRAVPPHVVESKRAAVYAVLSRFEWTGLFAYPWESEVDKPGALDTLMGGLYYKMLAGGGSRGVSPPLARQMVEGSN